MSESERVGGWWVYIKERGRWLFHCMCIDLRSADCVFFFLLFLSKTCTFGDLYVDQIQRAIFHVLTMRVM